MFTFSIILLTIERKKIWENESIDSQYGLPCIMENCFTFKNLRNNDDNLFTLKIYDGLYL